MAAESNLMGQAGGLAYTFQPMNRPAPVQQEEAQPTGTPFDTPTPPDAELANVENLTGNYYNAYSRLKDFTNTMWQDYGLDVTKPDLSQPGGGQFYQAYVNMDANLRMTAQDLKQQRKFMEEAYTSQLAGKSLQGAGFDPTKTLYTEAPRAGEYSTTLLPEVTSALAGVSNVQYGTQAEADRAWATLIPLRQSLEAKRNADPYNAQFWQRQIDALRKPTWEQKQFASKDGGSGSGEKEQKNFDPTLHLVRQGGVPGKAGAVQTKDGWKPAMIIPTDVSTPESYGTLAVKDAEGKTQDVKKQVKFRYVTEDGSVYERYQYPLDDPKYDERVDNRTVNQNLDDYYKLHPNATNWEKWKSEQMNVKNKSSVSESDIGLSASQIQEKSRNKMQNQTALKKFKSEIESENKRLEKLFAIGDKNTSTWKGIQSGVPDKDIFTIDTMIGPITFKRQSWDTKVKLDGASADLLENSNISLPKTDNLEFKDVNAILSNAGYYMKFMENKNQ